MDKTIREIVRDEYHKTKQLLDSKRELIEQLADKLIEKETVNLPDIIEILGERPYGMNETMREYLEEM